MPPPVDARVAGLAATQGGVVSRRQLASLGLSADAVLRRMRAGRLYRVHPTVFAVGHAALGQVGREWAAVLATDGVLSHLSAGAKLGVLRWQGRPEVTARRGRQTLAGVTVHTSRSLHADDIVLDAESGLPHTSWARTTVDVADLYDLHRMTRYLERSVIERRYDGRTLAAAMTRANGRRALKTLVAALNLGHHLDAQRTRSDLEELLLKTARDGDLGPLQMNHWMAVAGTWIEADVWFPRERLVIELDSRWHDTRAARRRDARRDAACAAAGIRSARLRKRDISLARLRAELDAARGGGIRTARIPR